MHKKVNILLAIQLNTGIVQGVGNTISVDMLLENGILIQE